MIYDNVKRLDIAMHDSMRVSKIKRFQNFVSVKPNVHVVEGLRDHLGFNIWNVFKHKTGRLWNWISDHIVQLYDVWTTVKGLKNLGLAIDFLLTNWLENLNYTGLIVVDVTTLVYFWVFASPEFLYDLVAFKFCPVNVVLVIKWVKVRSLGAYIFVGPHKLEVWFNHFNLI